ncbi:DUF6912 family protein [Nocardioides daejeonensis]|uniref:DUF6912 family protein n=1 Tax=Nocardioides daejeonensis TaxID=1046556 RepID=UPI000D74B0A1|nr:hypothetical protein [Nocardioides daejeonensis]
MSRRVYVPLTEAELVVLVDEQRLPAPRPAYALTAALREAWPDGDDDDLEYAALLAAADASWERRRPQDRPRRYVLAADVESVEEEGEHPAAVALRHDLVWRNVASAHVDTDDVTAEAVASDDAPDLAWFATQEIAGLR